MSFTSVTEPQPSLAWQFESSNVDSVTNLQPSSQVSPGPAQLVGSAALVTNAPTSNTAVYFPGTAGSYMNLGTSSPTEFNIGSSNLFVETWMYINSVPTNYTPIIANGPTGLGGSQENWGLQFVAFTATPQFFSNNRTVASTITPSLGAWVHVAASYNTVTSTAYMFVNGAAAGSVSGVITRFRTGITVIGIYPQLDTSQYSNMYIRDLRVVQGGIVPVATFTPGSAPFSYALPSYVTGSGSVVFTLLGQFVTYAPGKYNTGIAAYNNPSIYNSPCYITYNLSPVITETTGFTLSCWVNMSQLPASGSRMTFVNLSNGTGYEQGVWLSYDRYGSGTFAIYYENTGVSFTASNYNLVASVGTWYHICGKIERGTATIYVNGVAGTPQSYTTTGISYNKLYVLCHNQGVNVPEGLIGTLDDLRIYNTALTAAQVQSVYSSQGAPAPGRVMPQPLYAWDFNGTTAPYIGSATGTTTGTVSYNASGKYGQSLVIKNPTTGPTSANNINWITNSTFNMDSGFSVCFWLKVSTIPATDQSVIFYTNNSIIDYRYFISLGPSSTLSFVFYNNSTYLVPTAYTLSTNTWLHVVAQTVGGSMQFYINGTLFSSSAYAPSGCTLNAGLWLGGIGNYGPTNAEYDDLRIFDRALTSIQVNDIYNQQGVPGRGVVGSNDRLIYVAPVGTYPSYTPTSGTQFPVFNTSNVSFYSSGGTSGGTVGQYLDFGSQTFNMSTGFSAVCQFAFTNGIGFWERIFDFSNGGNSDNILFSRNGASTVLTFEIYNNNVSLGKLSTPAVLNQNQVYTAIVVYNPYIGQYGTAYIYFQGATYSLTYTAAPRSLNRTLTYVGRSAYSGDAYSNVNINYLSIYNRILTADEINAPLPTPQITLKGAPLFNQLSQAATSSAVGAFSLRAVNGVSTRAVQVRAQGQFPPAAMTSDGPQTLTGYSFGGSGSYVASASLDDVYIDYGFRAFDNNIGTWWHSNYPIYNSGTGIYITGDARASITGGIYAGEWLQIKMTTPILLTSYSLVGRPGFETNRSPRKFWILGSNNDGANWSLVDTQTNINTWASPQVFKTFTISNPGTTYFNTFRIVVNEVGNLTTGASGQDSVQIASWNLVGSPPAQDFYADERGNLLTAPVTGTTLQNWLGGATGYVTTWYDQSGRGNHMSCSSVGIQPKIDTANGWLDFKTSAYFDTSANPASGPVPYSNTMNYTVICHHNTIENGAGGICGTAQTYNNNYTNNFRRAGSAYQSYWYSNDQTAGTYATGNKVTFKWDGTNRYIYGNGTLQSTQASSNWWQTSSSAQLIGKTTNDATMNGEMYSIFMFNTSLSDVDRILVENFS